MLLGSSVRENHQATATLLHATQTMILCDTFSYRKPIRSLYRIANKFWKSQHRSRCSRERIRHKREREHLTSFTFFFLFFFLHFHLRFDSGEITIGNTLQKRKNERYRLRIVVEELQNATAEDYRTALLAFINCLVISTPVLKDRIRIRNEFIG